MKKLFNWLWPDTGFRCISDRGLQHLRERRERMKIHVTRDGNFWVYPEYYLNDPEVRKQIEEFAKVKTVK